MAKNLKLNIKNTQIAQAVNLGAIKGKISKKKEEPKEEVLQQQQPSPPEKKEEAPKIKARARSAFADGQIPHAETLHPNLYPEEVQEETQETSHALSAEKEIGERRASLPEIEEKEIKEEPLPTPEELRAKLFKDVEETTSALQEPLPKPIKPPVPKPVPRPPAPRPFTPPQRQGREAVREPYLPREKLGPTGKHIKDLIPPRTAAKPARSEQPFRRPLTSPPMRQAQAQPLPSSREEERARMKHKPPQETTGEAEIKKEAKPVGKFREFRDLKPAKRPDATRQFDARDRQGLRAGEDEQWRGKKRPKTKITAEEVTVRPTHLKIRVPISIKDLAEKMKLKASQLIGKLFLQGVVVTLNDLLEDETTLQLLGNDFGCEISIDTSEQERIRITDKSIREEIKETESSSLTLRPPVIAFMGHVDHGKTSLIDAIRSSNRAAGEAGAITQHIGAFRCSTAVGDITILDTPGHEAFSAMRARGADVTDITVLVVAGDEGIRQQTVEAIQHAKAAGVTIVVAINKSDKPNFNAENVYRQLSEHELLPEVWGGQTLTVNCSAVTKQGIKELLETLALQAEVLELKANPHARARGTVIESEMHKGMGAVATILVQNGTLRPGDSLVFGQHSGRIKTMRDEHGNNMSEAAPSTPVSIAGLSGLPEAGEEFIVVKNEKEAKEISEARAQGLRLSSLQLKKKLSMDNLLLQASATGKKILNIVLRADVQGSLEALKVALLKIESEKAELNIIFTGVGEISESDVQLAAASKAVIIGFHTTVEGHADTLVKELGVTVRLHDIIYHAIDDVKSLMAGLLDKIAQEVDKGKALVKATFKSSQHGVIAGCQVVEGSISRGNLIRVIREKEQIWRGTISSLKRVKEDVREVQKGLECGILLSNFNDVKEGDILEAFEITYLTQEL